MMIEEDQETDETSMTIMNVDLGIEEMIVQVVDLGMTIVEDTEAVLEKEVDTIQEIVDDNSISFFFLKKKSKLKKKKKKSK
jgi:hypothetical protein